MNALVLYLLLVKATLMSFGGLGSLPIIRDDLVVKRKVLTEKQLAAAVAAGRMGPGPIGLYVVSVGYFVAGTPGAAAGWAAMITPAFLIIPMLRYLGGRAEHPRIRSVIQALVVAVAGLIVTSTIPLAAEAIGNWKAMSIAVAAAAILTFTRVDTIWVMLGAAVAGLISAVI